MSGRMATWWSPTTALSIGLVACLLRVAIKLGVGIPMHSPLLTGDGFHNIGDTGYVIAALFIMWIVKWKRDVMHAGENMGVMFQFGVAWLLGFLALYVGYQSALGLMPCTACEDAVQRIFPFIPRFVPHHEDVGAYVWIIGALVVSIVISFAVSSYHIKAGRNGNYAALITIGKETRSDMLIECSILVGFIGEFLFRAAWIEYVFGIIVACLILRTAWELFLEANNTFLQVSISEEFAQGIRALVEGMRGVDRVVKLEAYPVLQAARVKVWVEAQGGTESNKDIGCALEEKIVAFAKQHDFSECRPDVYFLLPDPLWHRIAVAVVHDNDNDLVAHSFADADALRIYDVEYGEAVSAEDIPLPRGVNELIATLQRKHVSRYRAFNERQDLVDRFQEVGISHTPTPTLLPPDR